jgi:phospholipase C
MTSRIKHVVVLMLENRSFDHMLGQRKGVNGILGPSGHIDPTHSNPMTSPSTPGPKSYPVSGGAPFAVDPQDQYRQGTAVYGGPSHSFPSTSMQLFGTETPAASDLAAPKLNGFVNDYVNVLEGQAHRKNPSPAEISLPMATFDATELPVLNALADSFCVCDRWFSEVPGPTQPNRLFMHAATSMGFTHNVWSNKFSARTIYEALDTAKQTWGVYYFDLRDTDSFPAVKKRVESIVPFATFYAQAQAGTLPAYSFLCPLYGDTDPQNQSSSEHCPADVRYGEMLIADVYEALRNGPGWNDTLFILTYDEHGGFYDHVVPPKAVPPDAFTSPTADDKAQAAKNPKANGYLIKPQSKFGFDRLGLRVPTILISPWLKPGVDSTPYQHTSILATLHDFFGTAPLTHRDKSATSLAPRLTQLAAARTDAPTKLPRPVLPAANPDQLQKPPHAMQQEMAPILKQLDGHKDSGKVVPLPPTRGETAKYIAERIQAHNKFHSRKGQKGPKAARARAAPARLSARRR